MKLHDMGIPINWNMNQAYLQHVDRRREDKAQAAMNGDVAAWWAALWEIYENIVDYLDEEKEAKVTEKELLSVYKSIKGHVPSGISEVAMVTEYNRRMIYSDQAEKLRNLGLTLTKYIFKYKIIDMDHEQKTVRQRLQDGTRNR